MCTGSKIRWPKEGARKGYFGNVKFFATPLKFVQNMLLKDSIGTTYPRKVVSNNSYLGQNEAFGQFGNVLYNYKELKLLPLGNQRSSLVDHQFLDTSNIRGCINMAKDPIVS